MSAHETKHSRELKPDDYVEGVLAGDRAMLARAITLIESVQKNTDPKAREVLTRLLPHTGGSHRVGITGVPGVGKSTLIEALGAQLIENGHKVAVLAVDPSSTVSGGSILGDKSRMPTLANNPEAFIRPSPNALTPGGIGRRTRETQLLCEAAGYDIVLVETVGVGQAEIMVAEIVDTFVALMLPGAGDELQGIKKGVLELADVIVVNKADGDNRERAVSAKSDYDGALRYLRHRTAGWKPPVQLISARTGEGITELWQQIDRHLEFLRQSGELEEHRKRQRKIWMWALIEERLLQTFREHPKVRSKLGAVEKGVLEGRVPAAQAVLDLFEAFNDSRTDSSRDEH